MKSALVFCLMASAAWAEAETDAKGAVLRGLDKISGTTQDMDVETGGTATYGRLTIDVSACRYPANDPSSNAYAHLVIHDASAADAIFDGWMIASSPALSALDHPRYDVWVLRCKIEAAAGTSP